MIGLLRKRQRTLNPGDLNSRITVYGNVRTENELGEATNRFEVIGSLWAAVIPQTGTLQRQQADTILTNVTHKVVVRYAAGKFITKNMQLEYYGRRFDIKYILNPYERNETLELFCQELMN